MKKEVLKFVVLALLAIGGGPAMAAYWQWSLTAASNATSDPSINWAEGMSPSSVNDSARAMMARSAEERDDVSGKLVTAGTSTAYTLTTNQGLQTPTPVDGQLIAFTMSVTNGVAPTLAVDGGTALPIQTAPSVAVGAATLISGTPYTVKYSLSAAAWVLRNFYGNPFVIPIGAMLPYTGTTVPNANFVMPVGQAISRTTYAAYFALVGTTFGAGDGVTTFNVPDMRGRIPAGLDAMAGSANAGRLANVIAGGSAGTGNVGGSQQFTLLTGHLPPYTPAGGIAVTGTVGISGTGVPNANWNASGGSRTLQQLVAYPTGNLDNVLYTLNAAGSFSGTPQGGVSSPLTTTQPTMVVAYILRIF